MQLTPKQERWLQIMESGQYPQCTGLLKRETGHCCLGLICEFVLGIKPAVDGGRFYFDASNAALPYGRAEIMGLRSERGDIGDSGYLEFYEAMRTAGYAGERHTALTAYNDYGATFKQLAAAIRAVPEAVFTTPQQANS